MRGLVMMAMIAVFCLCAGYSDAAAGARTPLGEVIDDVQLPSTSGGRISILGGAKANVLVFFKPDQHSFEGTLTGLANCEKELAGKPVRWVAVVPARFSLEDAKAAAAAAGLRMPVVVDTGDAVHNLFGVAMHPSVGILDKDHRLVQFQPFQKLNFCEAVMARIRRVLGEIDDAGLARELDPSLEQKANPEVVVAHRDLKLAEMLLDHGNPGKALELARKGAARDPRSPDAQILIGRIYAAQGDCAAADAAFDASLKLGASRAQADTGRKSCSGRK